MRRVPMIKEYFADNGEHSHYSVIDSKTGEQLDIVDPETGEKLSVKKKEYKDHEFCKSVKCLWRRFSECDVDANNCVYTAKEFHKWLKSNGYRIVRGGE